jgi:hypothetical protein
MRKRPKHSPPSGVTELLSRINNWREKRSKPGRMPEELWTEATQLGRKYGVSLVSRHLKLDYHGLKRRVHGTRGTSEIQSSGFVELRMVEMEPEVSNRCDYVTEMEIQKRGEVVVRVRQSGPTGIDMAGIVESFIRGS